MQFILFPASGNAQHVIKMERSPRYPMRPSQSDRGRPETNTSYRQLVECGTCSCKAGWLPMIRWFDCVWVSLMPALNCWYYTKYMERQSLLLISFEIKALPSTAWVGSVFRTKKQRTNELTMNSPSCAARGCTIYTWPDSHCSGHSALWSYWLCHDALIGASAYISQWPALLSFKKAFTLVHSNRFGSSLDDTNTKHSQFVENVCVDTSRLI